MPSRGRAASQVLITVQNPYQPHAIYAAHIGICRAWYFNLNFATYLSFTHS